MPPERRSTASNTSSTKSDPPTKSRSPVEVTFGSDDIKREAKPATTWLETQYGLNISVAPGMGKIKNPHILSYAPGDAATLVAPVFSPSITVCFSWKPWASHLFWMLYAIELMLVCGFLAYPDGEFGKGHPCKGGNGKNVKMCQLLDMLTKAVPEFRFLIAFILAGFVARIVQMWGTRRKNYAALCGATRELLVLMGSFLEHPTAATSTNSTNNHGMIDPQQQNHGVNPQQARQTLARWIILAYELSVLKAKGLMDDKNQALAYLKKERSLIHGNEWNEMVPGDRHTTVYFWIQSYMVHLEKLGAVNSAYVMAFSQAVGRARAQANDLMSSLDRDLPFPYVNLCYILVSLNVLIFTTHRGVLWSTWLYQHGDRLLEQPVIWVDMLATLAWNVSYTSLYQLAYVLYNPFGNNKIDVAHETIGMGLEKLARNVATTQGFVPRELIQSAVAVQQQTTREGARQPSETKEE